MSIIIGADIVPTKSNKDLFAHGQLEELIGCELIEVLHKAEYRIFNLEVPLTDHEDPIPKMGPNLIASTASVNGLKSIGADLVTLANNHIYDQNEQGLLSTIEVLESAGISYVGAGKDLKAAQEGHIVVINGKKYGIYACTEHEFSIASEKRAGANPFEALYSLDHVNYLKNNTDYVIVLYHGGKEFYRYPSPGLQQICRRFIEKGADLVICQHSHCIGCEEKYKEGTILYGQGNFIFDGIDEECWRTSLLVKIRDDSSIEYIPLVKHGNGVRLADEKSKRIIISELKKRTAEIREQGFVEKNYKVFADNYLTFYLRAISGKKSIVFRILNRITRGKIINMYLNKCYGKHEKIRIANYINCEAHRELFSKALEVFYYRQE